MSRYIYFQEHGGEETWKPWLLSELPKLTAEKKPAFTTALAVSQLADDLAPEDRDKLKYAGPLYFDWDGQDMVAVSEQVHKLCLMLEGKGLDMACASLYATGGRGFHLEVPMACFMTKIPKEGVQFLPVVYKQLAFELAVDSLDFRVYSGGRGRMWRTCNVRRENGHYKVPITYEELQNITLESYSTLTSAPRELPPPAAPQLCMDLLVMFDHAQQAVADRLKKRKKKNTDPSILRKQDLPSLQALLEGRGVKSDAGFHQIALQLAIVAEAMGWSETELATKAEGLAQQHNSDSSRYNSPEKRKSELVRMHRYIDGNPCYEFSIGGLKSLLNHDAPDLDGIPVSKDEVEESIKAAEQPQEKSSELLDEYSDVAGAVDLTKYGLYAATDDGKKRICAISFDKIHILRSTQTGQVSCYEADVLINGKFQGRQTLELDIFGGLQAFNKFAGRHSHALQGSDQHVRGLMMRVAEKGKKEGKTYFTLNREGLDIVNITNHEDPEMREPFMVWADGKGVVLEPRIAAKGYEFSFQGFPDPRGAYKTDISDAPKLVDWLEEPGNKEVLRDTLANFIGCQQPNVIAKLLGWYVASFYRMLFHKVYSKFPILHVNGAAGAGKSLRKGTKVLRADGVSVAIEDVEVGDQLLGPTGEPRNVLALGRGRETMYEVAPVKGAPYFVNESHILSLRRAYLGSCRLSDGTYVPADQEVLNVNVKVWSESSAATQKLFKGYRAGPVEFQRVQQSLPMPPYILGAWLGDGHSAGPTISKPACKMVDEWRAYGASLGLETYEYRKDPKDCSAWRLARPGKRTSDNPARVVLESLDLLGNKHIPAAYRLAPVHDRLELIAGLLDSDGHLSRGGYDWISKCPKMAEDFVFICRSVGLAAYTRACTKGIKKVGFSGTYYRVSVSGDCQRIPCRDKIAPARKQIKNHLVTGLSFKKLGVEDYYGVVLDGDKLFLLDDFTVTHNTEMNRMLLSFFFYQQEGKTLTPGSTLFALQQHMSGSASIPLIIDEYKPHEMPPEMHGKLKLMIRDAYNCRDVTRGGGTRDNDDYRSLYTTQLAAPLVVIAEAAEEEAAVMERVVLATVVRPPASVAMKWSTRFHLAERNKHALSILGQYIASGVVLDYGMPQLTVEFDAMLLEAQQTFMLSEKDLKAGLSDDEMRAKQGAKERTVFNYTVTRFGLRKLRQLVKDIFDDEFEERFAELEGSVYDRMADLLPSTQAEWVKVLNDVATMSVSVEPSSPFSIRKGYEYNLLMYQGKSALELSARAAYHRYRGYCRTISKRPLFPGDHAFLHGLKDSPALLYHGPGQELNVPGGSYIFDLDELSRMGVESFKDR